MNKLLYWLLSFLSFLCFFVFPGLILIDFSSSDYSFVFKDGGFGEAGNLGRFLLMQICVLTGLFLHVLKSKCKKSISMPVIGSRPDNIKKSKEKGHA